MTFTPVLKILKSFFRRILNPVVRIGSDYYFKSVLNTITLLRKPREAKNGENVFEVIVSKSAEHHLVSI